MISLNPEIQKVLTDALIVLIPAFATWAATRLFKAKRDINAAFVKMRAHEEHLGIETVVERNGRIHVSSRPGPTKIVTSMDPRPLSQESGGGDSGGVGP